MKIFNKHNYININGYNSARLIFSSPCSDKTNYSFKNIIDDFDKTSVVRISSYNISEKKHDYLIKELYKLSENVKLKIVVGIPGHYNLERASKKAFSYLNILHKSNFKAHVEVSINVKNHAKIISTENICYIGSQNFSYGSTNNYEAGILITDKKVISEVFKEFDEIFESGVKYSLPNSNILVSYTQLINDLKSLLSYLDTDCEEELQYLSSEDLFDINMNSIQKLEELKDSTKLFLSVIDSYKLKNWNENDKNEFIDLVKKINIKELIELPDDEYIDPDEDFGIPPYLSFCNVQKLRDSEIENYRYSDYLDDLQCPENKESLKIIKEIENRVSSIITSANDYIDKILVNRIVEK